MDLIFEPPPPLLAGRIVFGFDDAPDLAKTRDNFKALCTGEKGMCKNAPNKKLHYEGSPIHRIVKGFIAQGGDITRGDGSGGEVRCTCSDPGLQTLNFTQSIYGGKFSDAKAGLRAPAERGSLAMANSGKNSNTSQFFIILTEDVSKLAKIKGKYVVFGEVKDGWDILTKLDEIGTEDGKPSKAVWISGCGLC